MIKEGLSNKKPKIKEKTCSFLETLLVEGNFDELEKLSPFKDQIIKLSKEKSPILRKVSFKLIKEAYLWGPTEIQPILDGLGAKEKSDFEKYKE